MSKGNENQTQTAENEEKDTWIFQANPDQYRIEDSLQFEDEELWNLRQHASEVSTGDRVLVWISGANAGIYAIGTVTTEPHERPDSATGQQYWKDELSGKKPMPRVLVRYDRVLEKPLLKDYLRCDPVLEKMRIITMPRATNFPVSKKEWRAIEAWLNEDEPSELLEPLSSAT